jgi:hypothetical protein
MIPSFTSRSQLGGNVAGVALREANASCDAFDDALVHLRTERKLQD